MGFHPDARVSAQPRMTSKGHTTLMKSPELPITLGSSVSIRLPRPPHWNGVVRSRYDDRLEFSSLICVFSVQKS